MNLLRVPSVSGADAASGSGTGMVLFVPSSPNSTALSPMGPATGLAGRPGTAGLLDVRPRFTLQKRLLQSAYPAGNIFAFQPTRDGPPLEKARRNVRWADGKDPTFQAAAVPKNETADLRESNWSHSSDRPHFDWLSVSQLENALFPRSA